MPDSRFLLVSVRDRARTPRPWRPVGVLTLAAGDLTHLLAPSAPRGIVLGHLSRVHPHAKDVGWDEALDYLVEGPLSGTTVLYAILPSGPWPLQRVYDHFVLSERLDPLPKP